MNNEPQNKNNLKNRATRGVATLLVAAGAAGCNNKPPSAEEVANVALEGAKQCQNAPANSVGTNRETDFQAKYTLHTSVPCDMAGDKAAIHKIAAEAAEEFAQANPGDTTIHYSKLGAYGQRAIFSYTTRTPSANTMPPLAETLSPRNANVAEIPASGVHTKAVEVSRAASAVVALK